MSQEIRKQPFIPFSTAGDVSAQFIQLLQALEQQEHNQGWPKLSSQKVHVQKCDKCRREYCSSINYRRHRHVHHRLRAFDKDAAKSRDWLAAFWDKLSVEDAKEVVSFKNVALEEIPGSSILKALSDLVRQSGFLSLPQLYVKAGSEILDIVQGRSSRFPISASELFTILDYASEKTFLCGSAVSMQRYVFNGDAGKTGLETHNLVACSSYLLEQKVINAWRADKDAEALRFHKLLMEEEEAARKRRAEDLEKKRQKRLKKKEQKEKEQRDEEKAYVNETTNITSEEKVDVNETIDNASAEKAIVKETIDNTLRERKDLDVTMDDALEEKKDANQTIDNASEEKAIVQETIDYVSEEKMDVSQTIDNTLGKKADVNETMENASEEIPSAETSSSVACDPQIDATNKPNVAQHVSTVEHSNPDMNLDLDWPTGFGGGQIDPSNTSPVDDDQFVTGRGRRWRRKMRKSQLATSRGCNAMQASQAPMLAITPSSPYVAKSSAVSKPGIVSTSSDAAWGSQAPKPAVAPTSSYAARVSQMPKPALASTSSSVRVSQALNTAIAPSSTNVGRISQAPKRALASTGSNAARFSQAPKPAITPSGTSVAPVFQSPNPAWASTISNAGRVSQTPKPALASTSSYAARVSQTPRPAVTPSGTNVARVSQSPKTALATTSSDAARVSQAPKPAVTPTSSYAAQVSQALKPAFAPPTVHVSRGSSKSKAATAVTSSDADEVFQESNFPPLRNRGIRTSPRTVSIGHKVWSPKRKPEFDESSSQARVQEDAPHEPAKTMKHEAIPSTIGDGSKARRAQKHRTNEPTQTKEHLDAGSQAKAQQETPSEQDQIKEHKFMIGSMVLPLNDFVRWGNKHPAATPDPQLAEPEKPNAPIAEPEKPQPSPRGTSGQPKVKRWREKLVPNGSRESECSTSGGIEIIPHRNLLEHGDWESAMRMAEIFLQQRWERALSEEHVTLVVESDSEDTDDEQKLPEKVVENVESPPSGADKSSPSTKRKKSTMEKYGPKRRLQT